MNNEEVVLIAPRRNVVGCHLLPDGIVSQFPAGARDDELNVAGVGASFRDLEVMLMTGEYRLNTGAAHREEPVGNGVNERGVVRPGGE